MVGRHLFLSAYRKPLQHYQNSMLHNWVRGSEIPGSMDSWSNHLQGNCKKYINIFSRTESCKWTLCCIKLTARAKETGRIANRGRKNHCTKAEAVIVRALKELPLPVLAHICSWLSIGNPSHQATLLITVSMKESLLAVSKKVAATCTEIAQRVTI